MNIPINVKTVIANNKNKNIGMKFLKISRLRKNSATDKRIIDWIAIKKRHVRNVELKNVKLLVGLIIFLILEGDFLSLITKLVE